MPRAVAARAITVRVGAVTRGVAGRVLVVTGPSAVGKTTVCRILQSILPEPFLFFEVDRCQPGLPPADVHQTFATMENDRALRDANLLAARAYVDRGFNMLIEGDFSPPGDTEVLRLRFPEAALAVLTCSEDPSRARIAARGDADGGAWALTHLRSRHWHDLAATIVTTDGRTPTDVAVDVARLLADPATRASSAD